MRSSKIASIISVINIIRSVVLSEEHVPKQLSALKLIYRMIDIWVDYMIDKGRVFMLHDCHQLVGVELGLVEDYMSRKEVRLTLNEP